MTPKISVLLAARDEARWIGRAVESILRQSFTDWELVIVDDGSRDDTTAVVERYDDPRIRLVREKPRGLAAALNTGLRVVSAPLVARQDADDESLPERLESQLSFLDAHPDVAVVGAAWIECGPDGAIVRPRVRLIKGRVNEALLLFNPLTHTSVVFRLAPVLEAGGYDESLPFAQDYDLWLRLGSAGHILWNLEKPLVVRHLTGQNIATTKERAQLRAELRIRWRDVRRRRAAGSPVGPAIRGLVLRALVVLAPLTLKRMVRRLAGRA